MATRIYLAVPAKELTTSDKRLTTKIIININNNFNLFNVLFIGEAIAKIL
ncbi:MAG: hypothetical protein PHC54_03520 [Candidatus Omnitrophica bacterium]|nr:hypothetical protein [Candidatus Omnitrophota bacterium]